MSPLESSGQPLFFKVADTDGQAAVPPPEAPDPVIRVTARSLSLMQKEAVVRGPGGTAWRLASDEGRYLLGDDVAPCPLGHMTAGMVASFMESLQRLAAAEGIDATSVQLIQDNYYTMQGSALRGTMTGGALPVVLRLESGHPSQTRALTLLLREAVRRAPITSLIEQRLPGRFTLTHNGVKLAPGRVEASGSPPLPRPPAQSLQPLQSLQSLTPESAGEAIEVASGDWRDLILRNGLSPVSDEITSSEGSSFAEEQSRRLHLRGICSLTADGIKTIEQHLLNPHGSIFHFRSEEAPDFGGQGRAPDALSYVSAGIAFCFMTQIGRYAKIARKKLTDYTIVQDTRFAAATDGNRDSATSALSANSASPIETHVFLRSDEDDDFARAALDMAEQTCFLHALARTGLRVTIPD